VDEVFSFVLCDLFAEAISREQRVHSGVLHGAKPIHTLIVRIDHEVGEGIKSGNTRAAVAIDGAAESSQFLLRGVPKAVSACRLSSTTAHAQPHWKVW